MEHNVLFDIEVYLNKEERLGGDWQSEIISRAFGSAFTNYFFSVNIQELIDKGTIFLITGNAERIGDHAVNIGEYVETMRKKNITFSENAREEVKAAADYVTGSNDEDGLVEVIEKFVLA